MTEVSPTSGQQPWEVGVSVPAGGTGKLRSREDRARPLPVRAQRAVGSAAQRGGPTPPQPRPSDVIGRGRGLGRGVPRLPAFRGPGVGHLPGGTHPRGLCPARPAGGTAASHRGPPARTRLFPELLQTGVGGWAGPASGPAVHPSFRLRTPPRGCGPSKLLWGPRILRWLLRLEGSWVKWPVHSNSLSPRDRPRPGTGGMGSPRPARPEGSSSPHFSWGSALGTAEEPQARRQRRLRGY